MDRLYFTDTPRAPHLYRIWNQLRELKQLPQVDRWLAQVFRAEKRFGKKDRQWYADAVFAAFRWGPLVLQAEELHQSLEDSACIATGWSELRGLPAERLFFWLSLNRPETKIDRYDDEQTILQQAKSLPLTAHGIPLVFATMLERRQLASQWSAASYQQFLERQQEKAPLWLRLNHPQKADSARRELADSGIDWIEEGESWRLDSGKNLQSLSSLEQGVLEIQDLASQEIGKVCDVSGSPRIWDCCAGGGGKTLQIASRMQGGVVFASDIRAFKMAEVKRRAERAKLNQVQIVAWDGQNLPHFPGPLDTILIDAPCSGTGTWRRSPDNKYRCDAAAIQDLQRLQISIIQRVLPALKSKGQLIYATCSWLVEENEDVVQAALHNHQELSLERQKLCGNPWFDADTMFYAVLRKQ